MRYTDIELEEFMFDDDNSGSFYIPCTDELVEMMDNIRKERGYTDTVDNMDNDVYYNYYLSFDFKEKVISLVGTCNHGEEDVWNYYQLPISKEEEMMLLWKITEKLFYILGGEHEL